MPLYPRALGHILKANINFEAHDIRVCLLGPGYSYNASHEFYSHVQSSEIAGTGYTAGGKALASKAVTVDQANRLGVWDAADPVWESPGLTIPSGIRFAAVYRNTGNPATSPLISYWNFGATVSPANAPHRVVLPSPGIAVVRA